MSKFGNVKCKFYWKWEGFSRPIGFLQLSIRMWPEVDRKLIRPGPSKLLSRFLSLFISTPDDFLKISSRCKISYSSKNISDINITTSFTYKNIEKKTLIRKSEKIWKIRSQKWLHIISKVIWTYLQVADPHLAHPLIGISLNWHIFQFFIEDLSDKNFVTRWALLKGQIFSKSSSIEYTDFRLLNSA